MFYVSPLNRCFLRPRKPGARAFYLEPLLVLGSIVLWLLVLPFAGLVCSAVALARRRQPAHTSR